MLETALARADYDLEAMEIAMRAAVLAPGAHALGQFMTAVAAALCAGPVECPTCRCSMHSTGQRSKEILTMLGPTCYTRARYRCAQCCCVRYPADEVLDIVNTSRSPSVRRQTARLGAKQPFHETATDLHELAGITLSRKDAERIAESVGADIETRDRRQRERIRFQPAPPPETPKTLDTLYIEMDGTGVPMVAWELQGRKGKQPDGSAKTREVKLGCLFTQTADGPDGQPMRDPGATSFTGAIEPAAAFGQRIYAEAVRRGLYQAKRVVVIADGAEWIRNLADLHFPGAIRIIDFYHAKQHVHELCKELFIKPERVEFYRQRWWDYLAQGAIETIIEQAQAALPNTPNSRPTARREIAYLDKNKDAMRYAAFQQQGLFIGSGVVEAGCKTIAAQRLKQSGMQWSKTGANSIIALRCAILSNRFQDYWEQRAA